MQTIKVNTRTTKGGVTMFTINGVCIGHVAKDPDNAGCYAGRINHTCGAMCHNVASFCDAVEFISDAICSHFEQFGLNVEFVNK